MQAGESFNPNVIVGSNVLIKQFTSGGIINVGFGTDVGVNHSYNVQEIRAIGDFFAKGAIPLFYSGTFEATFHSLHTPDGGLVRIPTLEEVLYSPLLHFEFHVRKPEKRIMKFLCVVNGEAWNLSHTQPSARRANFIIVRPETLEGYN